MQGSRHIGSSRETDSRTWEPGSLLSIGCYCLQSHLNLYIQAIFLKISANLNISSNKLIIEVIHMAGDKQYAFLKETSKYPFHEEI